MVRGYVPLKLAQELFIRLGTHYALFMIFNGSGHGYRTLISVQDVILNC